MVSRCLSATGIRFSVILFPPGSWALLTVGLPKPTVPDPDGVTAFRTHELRPGWAPSTPRGQRCSSRPRRLPAGRLPLHSGQSLHPAALPIDRVSLNEASTRVQAIRPSGLPLACGRPDGTGRPWASPGLRTPPTRSRTTHARVGTGHRARTWDYTLNSHQSISNPVVHSLCATSRRTSPRHSQRSGRTTNKRDRRETCGMRLERRRCFCPEAVVSCRAVGAALMTASPKKQPRRPC